MSRCSSVRVYIKGGPTHPDAMITTAGGTRPEETFRWDPETSVFLVLFRALKNAKDVVQD